jgi:DNA-directed RNA polymerase subunit E'
MIIANESSRSLRIGSKMRARITAVSLGKGSSMGKIGITCRQPFLGSFDWIKEEIEKSKQPHPQKEKKGGGGTK